MSRYRPRWRTDASGYVANFAGQWAGGPYADRAHLAEIVRQMPNGHHIEIVEVE